jgi:hypothetical protein
MGTNFVQIGEEVVVDLTNDSVTPDTLAKGVTAHDKSGNKITGTMFSNFRRWDITLTAGYPSSGYNLNLITDTWLKENRTNPNLCVVLLPKFTIEAEDVAKQGVFLNTNMPLVKTAGVTYYSLSAYKHRSNVTTARMRKYTLTNGNDIGDLMITTSGTLQAVTGNTDTFAFALGDYVVFAFIV